MMQMEVSSQVILHHIIPLLLHFILPLIILSILPSILTSTSASSPFSSTSASSSSSFPVRITTRIRTIQVISALQDSETNLNEVSTPSVAFNSNHTFTSSFTPISISLTSVLEILLTFSAPLLLSFTTSASVSPISLSLSSSSPLSSHFSQLSTFQLSNLLQLECERPTKHTFWIKVNEEEEEEDEDDKGWTESRIGLLLPEVYPHSESYLSEYSNHFKDARSTFDPFLSPSNSSFSPHAMTILLPLSSFLSSSSLSSSSSMLDFSSCFLHFLPLHLQSLSYPFSQLTTLDRSINLAGLFPLNVDQSARKGNRELEQGKLEPNGRDGEEDTEVEIYFAIDEEEDAAFEKGATTPDENAQRSSSSPPSNLINDKGDWSDYTSSSSFSSTHASSHVPSSSSSSSSAYATLDSYEEEAASSSIPSGAVSFLELEAYTGMIGGIMKILLFPMVDTMADISGTGAQHETPALVGATCSANIPPAIILMCEEALKQNLSNLITDAVTFTLTDALSKSLVQSIGPYVVDHLVSELAEDLSVRVEKVVKESVGQDLIKVLPGVMKRTVPILLTYQLGRSLTHSVVASVGAVISGGGMMAEGGREAWSCWRCYYVNEEKYCRECRMSRLGMYYMNYNAAYYSDYYSDYYTPYFMWSLMKVDRKINGEPKK